jgi:hypothetical protein
MRRPFASRASATGPLDVAVTIVAPYSAPMAKRRRMDDSG